MQKVTWQDGHLVKRGVMLGPAGENGALVAKEPTEGSSDRVIVFIEDVDKLTREGPKRPAEGPTETSVPAGG